jgi:hypothetical protein
MFPEPPDRCKVLTNQAHLYQGKTLYITNNDRLLSQLEDCSRELLQDAPSWESVYHQYEMSQDEMKKRMEKFESAKKKKSSSSVTNDGSKMQKMDYELGKAELVEDMSSNTSLKWPPEYVVHSDAHFLKFHASGFPMTKRPSNPNKTMSKIIFTDSLLYDELDAWTVSLLHCGVGRYEAQTMTEYKRSIVLKLFSKLRFIFSGRELVFGTNVEGLTNLFLDAEFGDKEPRSSIYQLMGRIGRMGHSYEAQVVLNSATTLQKILNIREEVDDLVDICKTIDDIVVY